MLSKHRNKTNKAVPKPTYDEQTQCFEKKMFLLEKLKNSKKLDKNCLLLKPLKKASKPIYYKPKPFCQNEEKMKTDILKSDLVNL